MTRNYIQSADMCMLVTFHLINKILQKMLIFKYCNNNYPLTPLGTVKQYSATTAIKLHEKLRENTILWLQNNYTWNCNHGIYKSSHMTMPSLFELFLWNGHLFGIMKKAYPPKHPNIFGYKQCARRALPKRCG